ncbi:MAG TPA: hypothetical protein VM008_19685 [Phycisphaerae bacterium]|nr:hypothetical protein [Phycisphaerae bacterium]
MRHNHPCVSIINGVACVIIEKQVLWSFVEFLSLHRVHAQFSYGSENFCARFPHHSRDAAQQLLEDWAAYAADRHEVADSVASRQLAP